MQNYNFGSITSSGSGEIYRCTDNGASECPEEITGNENLEWIIDSLGTYQEYEEILYIEGANKIEVSVVGNLSGDAELFIYNDEGNIITSFAVGDFDTTFETEEASITAHIQTNTGGTTGIEIHLTNISDIFNPATLYLYNYRNTMILSHSVTNLDNKTVKISLQVEKEAEGGDLINVTNDVEVPPGETLVIVGGQHKIILEYGDALKTYIKNANDDNLITHVTSIMNIYDFGFIPPIFTPKTFLGDTAYFGAGESYSSNYDKFDFAGNSNQTLFGTLSYGGYGKAACSDGEVCLFAGGSNYKTVIEAIEFSSDTLDSAWGTLYEDSYRFCANSDAITALFAGGYSYADYIQSVLFTNKGTTSLWANLYYGRHYMSRVNNSIYALWVTGYSYNKYIQYNEFATQANSNIWGELYRGYAYLAAGASNEERGLIDGDGYNGYLDIHLIDFSSQGNTTNFGNRPSSVYENGGFNNLTRAMFGGDEGFAQWLYEVSLTADFSFNTWGNCGYYDGGQPVGASGG